MLFSKDDSNLFQVADRDLKAKALRHSLLPRLRELARNAISEASRVFGYDLLADSTEYYSPHFRPARNAPIDVDYNRVTSGISPKRIGGKWVAMRKNDGQIPIIIEPRLSFVLSRHGLATCMEILKVKQLDETSKRKIVQWYAKNNAKIEHLLYLARARTYLANWIDNTTPFDPVAELVAHAYGTERRFLCFYCQQYAFPVEDHMQRHLLRQFVGLYPIYEGMVNLAMDACPRLDESMEKVHCYNRECFRKVPTDKNVQRELQVIQPCAIEQQADVMAVAESKVRVMPAMRWLVFQRDNWRCCACGKGSGEGAILQVDHIIPRSRGGKDSMDNYQTLCRECNIGKSNRDTTNLRLRCLDDNETNTPSK